ncbi:MAG: histidine--tRNA ligase [Limisphaerales bacterium]|jgi:histidyl-tRNA synthetase|nr:ATP phosphoribosyltransferase regulatory subunit [Verrucomicrobiota bacterium]
MDRLPGFRDFYPEPLPHKDVWSSEVRSYIFNTWRKISLRYGFREYDGPPLEPLELYTLKSGDEIVGQLYNFVDKGERQISLRPEMTPTLARMVAAHHGNYRKPIKWFSIPQLFRYERQQKGRLREHFQLNADIMGDDSSGADSEIIALAIDVLRAFGLTHEDFVIRLSSRSAWSDYFARRCSDQERAYEFYQIIDKLEREDPEVSRQKLSQLNLSYDEVTQFIASGEPTAELQAILDNLSARGLADFVKIDYGVIRGLAYYTGPVFEAFDRKGKFRAIAGGGRYDHLTQLISAGKVQIPSLGFGMGDVVLTELLKERGLLPEFSAPAEIYSLIEDESLRLQTLTAIQAFRDAGYSTDYALAPLKADRQFKRALELKARWTFRLEKRETPESVYLLKDLFTRKEERFGSLEQTLQFLQTQPH